ncbi:MAG: hypothetical protein AABZ59_08655, partial [Candidatus Binatota bacterium]
MFEKLKGSRVEGFKGFILLTLHLFIPLSLTTPALAQAPFYQGKEMRIVVGYLSGDSHDQLARVTARHVGNAVVFFAS